MGYKDHLFDLPDEVSFSILIISDSRTEATDETGKYLLSAIPESGNLVIEYGLVKNDALQITEKFSQFMSNIECDVVICSGGTGASHKDLTIETLTPFMDKIMDGFGEVFRHFSFDEIGTGAILSRATAGIKDGKVVIMLPGSLKAVKLAFEKIIEPEIRHLVREARR